MSRPADLVSPGRLTGAAMTEMSILRNENEKLRSERNEAREECGVLRSSRDFARAEVQKWIGYYQQAKDLQAELDDAKAEIRRLNAVIDECLKAAP